MKSNELEYIAIRKNENGKGFIAALDQSGGSTPKALKLYGIEESAYSGEEEMFDLVHQMRTRIIKSASLNSERTLGAHISYLINLNQKSIIVSNYKTLA